METIVLASGSPRRRELLAQVKVPFRIVVPSVVETHDRSHRPAELVARLSRSKVQAALAILEEQPARWVLGLDTVVESDGRVLGKPAGPEEARDMIRGLAGRVHRVYTGMALAPAPGRPLAEEVVCTEVRFRQMTEEEVFFYIGCGEWAGAAGAYRIQERGAFFVEWIKGSYSNVVGLPLEAFYGILVRTGYRFTP